MDGCVGGRMNGWKEKLYSQTAILSLKMGVTLHTNFQPDKKMN